MTKINDVVFVHSCLPEPGNKPRVFSSNTTIPRETGRIIAQINAAVLIWKICSVSKHSTVTLKLGPIKLQDELQSREARPIGV